MRPTCLDIHKLGFGYYRHVSGILDTLMPHYLRHFYSPLACIHFQTVKFLVTGVSLGLESHSTDIWDWCLVGFQVLPVSPISAVRRLHAPIPNHNPSSSLLWIPGVQGHRAFHLIAGTNSTRTYFPHHP